MSDDQPARFPIGLITVIAVVLILISFGLMFLPNLEQSRGEARIARSKHNLKMIGICMHNYHDVYGVLPPGKIVAANGMDYHGWPTMILTYADQGPLYNMVDFNHPFFAPENQSVRQVTSPIDPFQNPMVNAVSSVPPNSLGYALNNRVFLTNQSLSFAEITDGMSHTFMGGEIFEDVRPWFEPGHVRDPARGFNKGPDTFGTPVIENGVLMLMMDGSVHKIDGDIDPAVLKALATPAAGDDPKGYP